MTGGALKCLWYSFLPESWQMCIDKGITGKIQSAGGEWNIAQLYK